MLWQLQDYQEDKDHPQAQVVNIEVDELYVTTRQPCGMYANIYP
jgi:hypothetical protein